MVLFFAFIVGYRGDAIANRWNSLWTKASELTTSAATKDAETGEAVTAGNQQIFQGAVPMNQAGGPVPPTAKGPTLNGTFNSIRSGSEADGTAQAAQQNTYFETLSKQLHEMQTQEVKPGGEPVNPYAALNAASAQAVYPPPITVVEPPTNEATEVADDADEPDDTEEVTDDPDDGADDDAVQEVDQEIVDDSQL